VTFKRDAAKRNAAPLNSLCSNRDLICSQRQTVVAFGGDPPVTVGQRCFPICRESVIRRGAFSWETRAKSEAPVAAVPSARWLRQNGCFELAKTSRRGAGNKC
jgi:hypothetical protein